MKSVETYHLSYLTTLANCWNRRRQRKPCKWEMSVKWTCQCNDLCDNGQGRAWLVSEAISGHWWACWPQTPVNGVWSWQGEPTPGTSRTGSQLCATLELQREDHSLQQSGGVDIEVYILFVTRSPLIKLISIRFLGYSKWEEVVGRTRSVVKLLKLNRFQTLYKVKMTIS